MPITPRPRGRPAKADPARTDQSKTRSRSAVPLLRDHGDVGDAYARDRKFVWALARGLELLRAFAPGRGALGNSDLAALTGLPKPTVSRLTYTLTELGYLTQVSRTGKYEPAPPLLALGHPVLGARPERLAARNAMRELAELAQGQVALAAPDGLAMMYVERAVAVPPEDTRLEIGSRVEMVRSSLGRAWLSALSEAVRAEAYARFRQRYRDEWPALEARVEASMAEVRRRGFCLVDGEWVRGVRAVAVPVLSRDGTRILAMNCTSYGPGPADRLERELGPKLVEVAGLVGPLIG
jgi:DNA-binding IclR family transcriptional regulator